MSKIAVIIPVFNVEQYLSKCLDSVISQTHSNLEIIVINDGSTDNTKDICDEYAASDKRIKVFHKKHGGISAARNIGLDYALKHTDARYIGFVDGDDHIMPEMYSELYSAIRKGVNIAVCSYFRDTVSSSEEVQNLRKIRKRFIPTKDMMLYSLKREFYEGFCGFMWNKLFSIELFDGLRFDESIKCGEGILLYSQMLTSKNAIGTYIDKPLYHYLRHEDALIKSEDYDIIFDVLKVYKLVEELLNANALSKYAYLARGRYCSYASHIAILAQKNRDRETFSKIQIEIRTHHADYKRTSKAFSKRRKLIKDIMNCKLVNICEYSINDFAKQISDSSIVCFGAGDRFEKWIQQNAGLIKKISAIIDNEKTLKGAYLNINNKKICIYSFSRLIKKNLNNYVILLTTPKYYESMIWQLDSSGKFENVSVYIAKIKESLYDDNNILRKLQLVELEIFDEFVRICNKHKLKYYLAFGTLLGAIRHKGFIPWDDDIDIWMPRSDFEQLIRLPEQEFQKNCFVHYFTTDSHYPYMVMNCRISMKNTVNKTIHIHDKYDNGKSNKISISIFPINKKRYNPGFVNRNKRSLYIALFRIQKSKQWEYNISIRSLFNYLPLSLLIRLSNIIYKSRDPYSHTFKKDFHEIFGEGVPVMYEGRLCNAPQDYNHILSILYTTDYMKLPPLYKRVTHLPLELCFNTENKKG